MSQNPVVTSILELEKAMEQARKGLAAVADTSRRVVWAVAAHADMAGAENVRCSELGDEVVKTGELMRRAGTDARAVIVDRIDGAIVALRHQVWMTALPPMDPTERISGLRHRGHLREFSVPGEPELPPGYRYEATPLLTPGVPIDIDVARQGEMGDCYFIAAINAVAQWYPMLSPTWSNRIRTMRTS